MRRLALAATVAAMLLPALPASASDAYLAPRYSGSRGACGVIEGTDVEAPRLNCWGAEGAARLVYRFPGEIIQAKPAVEWESFGARNPDVRVLVKGSRVVVRLVARPHAQQVGIWDVQV